MDYLLDPSIVHLNHGSFGACPVPVFERYQELQLELERNPVEFLGRRFDSLVAEARGALAAYVGARGEDLVFVPNATSGLNAVIRSLRLLPGDEVLTTRHEYGAVMRTWEFAGANLVYAEPEEVVDAIGPRTRIVSVSHITSPTALLVPVAEICAAAREAGALAVVDGAACAGSRPARPRPARRRRLRGELPQVALGAQGRGLPLGAAGASALDRAARRLVGVRRRPQLRRPARLARHARSGRGARGAGRDRGASARSTSGAADGWPRPSTTACRPSAPPQRRRCGRRSCRRATPRSSSGGSLAEYRIEVPVVEWEGRRLLRVSVAPYNDAADLERLLAALAGLLHFAEG